MRRTWFRSGHVAVWMLSAALLAVLIRGWDLRRTVSAVRNNLVEAQAEVTQTRTEMLALRTLLSRSRLEDPVILAGMDVHGQEFHLNLAALDEPMALVVVDPTCPLCLEELPEIQAVLSRIPCPSSPILGIATGPEGLVEELANDQGFTFPILLHASGDAWDTLPLQVSPVTAMFSPDGKLDGLHVGRMGDQEFVAFEGWVNATCATRKQSGAGS